MSGDTNSTQIFRRVVKNILVFHEVKRGMERKKRNIGRGNFALRPQGTTERFFEELPYFDKILFCHADLFRPNGLHKI